MSSQLKNIPTEVENKIMESLFLAIYFNDLEKVIEFKQSYPELYAKKDHFLLDGKLSFSLANLTFFNKVIWFEGNWREAMKPLVEKHKLRTEKMFNFWHHEYGQQLIHSQTEYNKYFEYFSCYDPNDPDSKEKIILDTITFFLAEGFREIDLKLYNRVAFFNFIEAKKLLEQGAMSNIYFYKGEDDSSAISGISVEISYLSTCEVIPEFEVFEEKGYKQTFRITRMFGDILGLAAHIEMYHLLVNYQNDQFPKW